MGARARRGSRLCRTESFLLQIRLMLTWAVAFLLIAIFAGVFGFVAVGPSALIVFAIFFVFFLAALVQHLRSRH